MGTREESRSVKRRREPFRLKILVMVAAVMAMVFAVLAVAAGG